MNCTFCGNAAELVKGTVLYPHRKDIARRSFWRCQPCHAWVGCHPGTDKPLGTLANLETRSLRMRAHQAFDPIWRNGEMSRGEAYRWLAEKMGVKAVHIGESDCKTCLRIIQVCSERV